MVEKFVIKFEGSIEVEAEDLTHAGTILEHLFDFELPKKVLERKVNLRWYDLTSSEGEQVRGEYY